MSAEQLKAVLRMLDLAVKKEDKKLAVATMRGSWSKVSLGDNIIGLYPAE